MRPLTSATTKMLDLHRDSEISCCCPEFWGILQLWIHRTGLFISSSREKVEMSQLKAWVVVELVNLSVFPCPCHQNLLSCWPGEGQGQSFPHASANIKCRVQFSALLCPHLWISSSTPFLCPCYQSWLSAWPVMGCSQLSHI